MRTRVIRTIHPIGQGAFYSERFYALRGDRLVFSVVYDCGAGIGRNVCGNAKHVIKSFAHKLEMGGRPEIDILFISHFHSDHINGIKELAKLVRIKNIVMPYMDMALAKKLQLLHDKIHSDESLHTFVNPYHAFEGDAFKETRLIYVVSEKDEKEVPIDDSRVNGEIHFEEGFRPTVIDIDHLSISKSHVHYFKSGNAIVADNCMWFYLPFTREDKVNDEDFLDNVTLLNKRIEDYEKLHPNQEWITDDNFVKDIREEYKKIDTNLNNTSMLVLSASVSMDWNNNYIPLIPQGFHPRYCRHLCHQCYRYFHHSIYAHPSCLYTGDIFLDKAICDLIIKKVQGYKVGTLQIPHHGSKNGWQADTKTNLKALIYRTVFFMSFGLDNPYGHPHKETLNRFRYRVYDLYAINEISSTRLEQNFIII